MIDAAGLCLAPGLVDMRVQLGEPGAEHKERIDSGAAAAAAGGVTSMAVPAQHRPADRRPGDGRVRRPPRPAGEAAARSIPTPRSPSGCAGQELAEIGLLKAAGAVGLHRRRAGARQRAGDAPRPVLRQPASTRLIVQHPEEPALAEHGVMNEGELATRASGLAGIPPVAEVIMVERDLRLVELTGGRLPRRARLDRRRAVDAIRARQGARPAGHLRHGPALPRAQRARGRGLPHLRQGLAAAARRGRPARGGRGPRGRHDRRDRQRPLPAGPGQQAPAVRPGRVRRDRRSRPCCRCALRLVHEGELGLLALLRTLTERAGRLLGLDAGRLRQGRAGRSRPVRPRGALEDHRGQPAGACPRTPPSRAGWSQGRVLRTLVDGRTIYQQEMLSRARAVGGRASFRAARGTARARWTRATTFFKDRFIERVILLALLAFLVVRLHPDRQPVHRADAVGRDHRGRDLAPLSLARPTCLGRPAHRWPRSSSRWRCC